MLSVLVALFLPTLSLILLYYESTKHDVTVTETFRQTCVLSIWVHSQCLAHHILVKGLTFLAPFLLNVVAYTAILRRLHLRGMCKHNMKCTKISIRASAVSLVSIMTWIPTIVARTFLKTNDITVIKATEYVFYLNTFFDPLIYIFGERVLNMIPWLNPPSEVEASARQTKTSINFGSVRRSSDHSMLGDKKEAGL